ncbi:manganese catalase family protein, partial [Pseudomonas syringae pv. tagetis]|uniref:manganese catalase family protein n=1 Tax=Pseudomonas syringae group genomosp. 7 TaxID=251699 RepID=UPI00376F4929
EVDPGRKDQLKDIATEELCHLVIVVSNIVMLNKCAKGQLGQGIQDQAALYRANKGNGNATHITTLMYGAGAPSTTTARVPITAGNKHN